MRIDLDGVTAGRELHQLEPSLTAWLHTAVRAHNVISEASGVRGIGNGVHANCLCVALACAPTIGTVPLASQGGCQSSGRPSSQSCPCVVYLLTESAASAYVPVRSHVLVFRQAPEWSTGA
jgi:hypothetical protein